jgi:hypothetical protein
VIILFNFCFAGGTEEFLKNKLISIHNLENDRMPTKYGLFNIITHRAKDFALSKRILIEEVAGGMVNLLSGGNLLN